MTRGKSLLLWQSEERQLEVKTGYRTPNNLFDTELYEMNGRRATIMLKSGEKFSAILISNDENILALKGIFSNTNILGNLSLIPIREVLSVAL